MKYYKKSLGGTFQFYEPDKAEYGSSINIPHDPGNADYAKMMEEVDAGTSEIIDIAMDHVDTYVDKRREAYGNIGDQLDMLYHDMTAGKGDKTGEWYKAIKKVKDDNPKPS